MSGLLFKVNGIYVVVLRRQEASNVLMRALRLSDNLYYSTYGINLEIGRGNDLSQKQIGACLVYGKYKSNISNNCMSQ